jgi:transcriptional regulator with XRE-family HTH domain
LNRAAYRSGANLRALRRRAGLSAHELGALLGKAAGTVACWEGGARPIPRMSEDAICEALACSPGELYGADTHLELVAGRNEAKTHRRARPARAGTEGGREADRERRGIWAT